jgi:hypothetical protein
VSSDCIQGWCPRCRAVKQHFRGYCETCDAYSKSFVWHDVFADARLEVSAAQNRQMLRMAAAPILAMPEGSVWNPPRATKRTVRHGRWTLDRRQCR